MRVHHLLLVTAVIALAAPEVRAGEEAPDSHARLEWAGAELLPVSLNAGTPPSGAPSPSRLRAGLGGTLRLLRLRWTDVYWTPVEGSVFVAGGGTGSDGVVLLQVATEGGVRLPVGDGAFEVGLGVGFGGLAVNYAGPNNCDGDCAIGGVGAMLSPVARYLVRDRDHWSVGFVLRGEVPLQVPHGEWTSTIEGFGALVLAGVDVAYGR